MNAEAVREAENFSRMQVGLDELIVQFCLGFIGSENVNPVGALCGLVWSHNEHPIGARLLGALAGRIESDDDLVTAIAEILRLRVTLAAVANDRDRLALQRIRSRVPLVKNSDCHRAPLVATRGRKKRLLPRESTAAHRKPTGRSVCRYATVRLTQCQCLTLVRHGTPDG